MHDLRRAEWRTSTFSGGNGSCVEVASNLPGIIAVRDSKDRQGPALVFTASTLSLPELLVVPGLISAATAKPGSRLLISL